MYVLDGEIVSVRLLRKKLANEQAQQFQQLAESSREEVDSVSAQLQTFTTSLVNQGQTIDKVSHTYTQHTIKNYVSR